MIKGQILVGLFPADLELFQKIADDVVHELDLLFIWFSWHPGEIRFALRSELHGAGGLRRVTRCVTAFPMLNTTQKAYFKRIKK